MNIPPCKHISNIFQAYLKHISLSCLYQAHNGHISEIFQDFSRLSVQPDMEKGVDTRTLSAEIFENCGNFFILEDYAPLLSEENLFLVEMFDETFDIWNIYSL